jgi:hydroxyacid-oxoacid transhydrogenase
MATEYVTETVFTWGAPPVKFGVGAVDEIGYDCAQLGMRRVLVVTDEGVAATGIPARVAESLEATGLASTTYDGVRCEPTDESFGAAVEFARSGEWDGFVAVGGGSSIDTAKTMNLLTSNDGELMDYVNKPIGGGRAPSNPLRPLVAVPTTAGTGSESTAVSIMDIVGLRVKSGISHPRLRPLLAIVDPATTLSLPPHVTAASGMDVLCHALESYTARPHRAYPRHAPEERAAYVGSNPVSDAFIEKAVPLVARSLRRAVLAGHDLDARSDMMLAALFAGMGFGNAGVHVPHACAYPIAGRVTSYRPPDYPKGEPMVPHGESVSLTAPAAFRFTFACDPDRHVRAASWLDPAGADAGEAPERLPRALVSLMRDIGIASGLAEVGYGAGDVPALVDGTMKQRRLLSMAPRDITAENVASVLQASMANW